MEQLDVWNNTREYAVIIIPYNTRIGVTDLNAAVLSMRHTVAQLAVEHRSLAMPFVAT